MVREMAIRVIQWATGGVGQAAIQAVAAHPELELVGCWVHSADKVGLDAGEIAGTGPLGVRATQDVDQLLSMGADCVVYAPLMPDEALVCRMLTAGIDVVTPLGWVYPRTKDAADLEAACLAGGATLHGTGIHPGGITERFPLMESGDWEHHRVFLTDRDLKLDPDDSFRVHVAHRDPGVANWLDTTGVTSGNIAVRALRAEGNLEVEFRREKL